jgi:hypothetical protein
MQPKWILYSLSAIGLLIVLATNIIEQAAGGGPEGAVIPAWAVAAINIGLPFLLLLRRTLGDAAKGIGQPPVTILPPTPEGIVESLETQRNVITKEIAVARADAA